MKLLTAALFMLSLNAFATQVDTECIAQSENREKIIKNDTKSSNKTKSGAAIQG